jgi:hypothetical protein
MMPADLKPAANGAAADPRQCAGVRSVFSKCSPRPQVVGKAQEDPKTDNGQLLTRITQRVH